MTREQKLLLRQLEAVGEDADIRWEGVLANLGYGVYPTAEMALTMIGLELRAQRYLHTYLDARERGE